MENKCRDNCSHGSDIQLQCTTRQTDLFLTAGEKVTRTLNVHLDSSAGKEPSSKALYKPPRLQV